VADIQYYDVLDPLDEILSRIHACPRNDYVRYDPIIDQIKEARREDDASLSQGIWVSDKKKADWPAVIRLCLDVLSHRSKDLNVLIWLIEAWIALEGTKGAERGLKLMTSFCRAYWMDLHPHSENGDLESRLYVFDWFDRLVSERLLFSPLVCDVSLHAVPTLSQWQESINTEQENKRTLSSSAAEFVSKAQQYKKILKELPHEVLRQSFESIDGCIQTVCAMRDLLTGYMGDFTPRFVLMKKTLDQVRLILIQSCNIQIADGMSHTISSVGVDTSRSGDVDSVGAIPNEPKLIEKRADVYVALDEISLYLKSIDPHSPAPLLLDLIVLWKDMNLIQIINDLKSNQTEAHELMKLLAQVVNNR
jgi:type VI secretion system protein ImpA